MKRKIYLLSVLVSAGLLQANCVSAQWTRNGATQQTYLTNTGDNVGIGTTNPSFKLDIRNGGVATMQIKSTNNNASILLDRGASNNTASLTYRTAGSNNWQTGCVSNNNFTIRNNHLGAVAIYADYGDNKVGIGTTTPNAKLSVADYALGGIATDGAFQIGQSNTYNLVFDDNEVQSRNNGVGNTLYLNYWGGNVDIAATGGSTTMHGPAYLYSTANIYGNTYVGGTLGVGLTPTYTVDVTSTLGRTGNFINTSASVDHYGLFGSCNNTAYYGYGVVGYGGYIGLYGAANLTGSGSRYAIYGYAYGGTTNWAVYASGQTYSSGGYTSSDAKLKKDVRTFENAMDKINLLQPRTYTFKSDEYKYMGLPTEQQYGFIAQELETVFPELVKNVEQPIDNDKKNGMLQFKAINYVELIPVLTAAMQEQNKTIDNLKNENASLKARMDMFEKSLSQCCSNFKEASSNEQEAIGNGTRLEQNQPNPFNSITTIRYSLTKAANTQIIIRDLSGNLVKSFNLAQTGKGQVTVNANQLAQGTYTYTLVVNGNAVDTKLMVITK